MTIVKRVVFLCYHGFGHINPCFPLARLLIGQGHRITLATSAFFNGYVTRSGFDHYPLKTVPFGLGFEYWTNQQRKKRFIYWSALLDRINDRLYHEREQELTTLLDTLRPDIIFVDATQATDFIILHPLMQKRHVRCAMLHPMFPTHVLPGRPPANSAIWPGDKVAERRALKQMMRKLNYVDLKQRIAYFGFSDRYIIDRRLRRNQTPKNFRLQLPTLFDFQVTDVPDIIPAPKEFDYPHFEVPAQHHYIGFMHASSSAAPHSLSASGDENRWSQARNAILIRKQNGSRLVYCSFGTVMPANAQEVDLFLARLVAVVQQRGDMLVISGGAGRTIPSTLAGDGVWLFSNVPQIEVLGLTDVFLTHGGLSSIREAIDALVPMLMITVHNKFDPPGNAARVEYHGLGTRGSIRNDVTELGRKLDTLLSDGKFRSNLTAMREKNKTYTPERFLALFEAMFQ